MENEFISLLYPDEAAARDAGLRDVPIADADVCEELGLFRLMPQKEDLCRLFSDDERVLVYRRAVIRDLSAYPEAEETLLSMARALGDIAELRSLSSDAAYQAGETYLYSVTEIELYVSVIENLYRGFLPIHEKFESESLKKLWQFAKTVTENEDYRELNEHLKKLSSKLREVRSVTIGVNLDGALRPTEAGVLSVNAEAFHSGTTLDKIMRLSFRPDATTCIARLTAMGKEQDARAEAVNGAVLDALGEVYRSSVRGWRQLVADYVSKNTDVLLRLLPEIRFVNAAVALERSLLMRGQPLCEPVFRPKSERTLVMKGLYHPDIALRSNDKMVGNDCAFEGGNLVFVVTGPNRGGKSVYTTAIGLGVAFAQLGLRVPSLECTISPVDRILIHFPQGADDTIDKGRLGEECARLRSVLESATERSLLLLDESLSSTGACEATYIAADLLSGFAELGCRTVFSTHLHDLAAQAQALSDASLACGGSAIRTLVAEMTPGGERSFRVIAAQPDGKSYARDIAEKYGLGQKQIGELIRRRTEKD